MQGHVKPRCPRDFPHGIGLPVADLDQRHAALRKQAGHLRHQHAIGIKALRPGKDGAMRIISINPDWPEEVAYDGEMNVIGRVVAIVRKC